MNYDFEVDAEFWDHLQFGYRVVYHTGILSNQVWNNFIGDWVERGHPNFPYKAEKTLQTRNHQKISGYLEQMMAPDQYLLQQKPDGILYIYCNEWIDDAILQLRCTDDQHFLKPAYVEHLNET